MVENDARGQAEHEAPHVGRAQVRPPQPEPEPAPRTSVLPVAPVPPPVFVDPTGKRRRTLYLMAAAIILAIVTGVLGVWLGLFAGSVAPAPVLTCPAGTTSTSCAPR